MNIFYYSVHQILEFDEVNLFREMGHDVFRLDPEQTVDRDDSFRPKLGQSPREKQLADIYTSMGGTYGGKTITSILPHGFIEHFSLSIIMDDPIFITELWSRLASKPIIWRTIGQGIDQFDRHLQSAREKGMKIARYSPVELKVPGSIGADAIIRFSKDHFVYNGWTGEEKKVLTFANSYAQRYPADHADYLKIVRDVPSILGGSNNLGTFNSIGQVTHERQLELYRKCKVYLYASGLHIPYTLNFLEAWLIGIPLVVYAPVDRQGEFFEIDKLVSNGHDGFICRDEATAKKRYVTFLRTTR